MLLREQLALAGARVDEIRIHVAGVVLAHMAIFAVVAAEGPQAIFARRDLTHGAVGELQHFLVGEVIDAAEGARAIELGADLLHGLDVIVFPVPEINGDFVFVNQVAGLFFRGGLRAAEEEMLAVATEGEIAAVADEAAIAEAGRGGGDELDGRRSAALPVIELELGWRAFGLRL